MSSKKEVKKPASKPAVKSTAKAELKPETFIGKSSDFSFKKAFKDALLQASKHYTGNYKFEVLKIEYEKGGATQANHLLVTIKKVMP